MKDIHPTAHVDKRAELADDVVIGPFSYIGPGVTIGEGTRVASHVTIEGPTTIGRNNRFYPQCVIGAAPQDLKYRGGATRVVIGDDNLIREFVTIHRGTEVDEVSGGTTRIGNHNLLMIGAHVAHDSTLCDRVIIGNGVQIAGHCFLEDYCNVSAMSGMHHFVTVGRYAYVGGLTRVVFDVPPYCIAHGYEMAIRALNSEGLRRWKFEPECITALKTAFRRLFRGRAENAAPSAADGLRELLAGDLVKDEHVRYLVEFVQRQLNDGVHGRTRERRRTDVPADRGGFYEGGKFREIAATEGS